jgi:hypothetical protein
VRCGKSRPVALPRPAGRGAYRDPPTSQLGHKKRRKAILGVPIVRSRGHQYADTPHPLALRARPERPSCRRAPEQGDERAPFHSITSSAESRRETDFRRSQIFWTRWAALAATIIAIAGVIGWVVTIWLVENGEMKKRRVYKPRIIDGKVMMPADLKRLHKYMLEIERIDHVSDEMRAVVEQEWPELAHKLPPKAQH